MIKICHVPLLAALLLSLSCVTPPPPRLSGRTDIPMLLPGDKFASWATDEEVFDNYCYYRISKTTPSGKSITISANKEGDPTASPSDPTVMIPEIGMVNYRHCAVGGDEERARYKTNPFSRDDGRGGKVFYVVRVNTDDGDQEAMLKSVKWAAPGSDY